MLLADWIVVSFVAYVALGVVFAVPFVLRGVNVIDPIAVDGTWGFRLIIIPGVVALWPILLRCWLRGRPLTERNPHRDAAREGDAARERP